MSQHHLIILGAGGDLTSRYLMPALARLLEMGKLPGGQRILGVDREGWDTDAFRRHIAERLGRHAPRVDEQVRSKLLPALQYRQANVSDPGQLREVLGSLSDPIVIYLALPPQVAASAVEALAETDLPADSRVVAEKPFGHGLASARKLNQLIARSFPERAVFRVDHFLGKQTVQNVLGLRFANRVFEYVWNRDHVDRVDIVWDETNGLEGRAGYYDTAGALRDMIQNHLLQLLCLVGLEAPISFDERDFRDRKADVLRSVRTPSPEEVRRLTVRGRYTAGRAGDVDLPSYVDEPGVDPSRNTETFAQVTLFIDNWRWAGVPFVLRSGKALSAGRREMCIRFRPVPHLPFESAPPEANLLRLQVDPDRMALRLNINGPGNPFDLESVALDTVLAEQEIPAYGRLLLDVLEGDPVLSIRGDEAEESWRIVEPILAAWAEGRVPLRDYSAGSNGPIEEATDTR